MSISRFVSACVLLCLSAVAAAHQGTHERLDHINHRIEEQPDSQQLYLARGRLHAELQRFDAARADFDTAARLGPANVVVFDYGLLCYQMADLECALREFNRTIELYPGNVPAYEYRSRVHRQLKQPAQALADLKRYFEVADSPSPALYVTASQLSEELGAPEEGLSILDAGMGRLGVIPQLQRRAVEIELGLGNTAAAIERWASCREALRDSAEWKIEMARLLMADGQAGEAALLLSQARSQLATLRPTPARVRSGEEIAELELQLQQGAAK